MTVCWMISYHYSWLLGFKCIFQLYTSGLSISYYGHRYHAILSISQLHPITVFRTAFGVFALFRCWGSLCVPVTNSLIEFYFIRIAITIIWIFMAIIFILICTFRLSLKSDSANAHVPGRFRLWTFALNIGLMMLHSDSFVMFRFSTRVVYREVLGFATDCPCCIWCRGFNHLPPAYRSSICGKLVWIDNGFVGMT